MNNSGERLIALLSASEPDTGLTIDTFLERHNAKLGKAGAVRWEIPVREWQRFEFLGDRVISLIVAGMLHSQEKMSLDEGEMTRILGSVVSNRALDSLSRALDEDAFQRLIPLAICEQNSYGERITGGAFEAFIGALYCEFGFNVVSVFVRVLMKNALDRYDSRGNPISILQEHTQKRGLALPTYREVGRTGPVHGPTFNVCVEIDGVSCTGIGSTLAGARQDAARTMLEQLGLLPVKPAEPEG